MRVSSSSALPQHADALGPTERAEDSSSAGVREDCVANIPVLAKELETGDAAGVITEGAGDDSLMRVVNVSCPFGSASGFFGAMSPQVCRWRCRSQSRARAQTQRWSHPDPPILLLLIAYILLSR